ncbi:MAG: M24 family metallopeptidase [Bacteroidetes bacterium]|nr:M24 family metallopeptidase [Bacteroidota bacterium]
MKRFLILGILLYVSAASAQSPLILSQREQATVMDDLLDDRLKNLLPGLMSREGFDMWVIISREYNEDPVIKTMLPATWMASRRTTMFVMFDRGADKGVEFLAVARYDVGKTFKRAWDPEKQPDQWAQLAKLIEERNPQKIGVNKAPGYAHADGISSNDYDLLIKSLAKPLQSRVASAERLAVSWLETRSEKEMVIYPQICRIAHEIIAEGFSDRVIQPGVTTAEDVVWWYREKIKSLKLDTWFHPSVEIQREGSSESEIIMPGDLLHVDFGITYLRLNTDTQQHAYVLKPGETDAPAFLKQALKKGNQLQDILTGTFKVGKTGNQVLAESRKQATAQGLVPSIYTHPIGYHGHAAGTNFGMWDMQGGVPFTGEYPMHANTAYSIELNVTVNIPEWKKDIRIMLEEDGYFGESGFRYIDGRQTELILISK